VREDFDRIARALHASGVGDELAGYERALLRCMPSSCERVLEVGCGDGALTRQVARRARSVLALDLSPEMIRLARARSAGFDNIDYRLADVTATDLPRRAFDVVFSAATLHHVPLAPTLERLAESVRPGGVLLVQDLVSRPGLLWVPVNAAAWLARRLPRVRGPRHGGVGSAVSALYRVHGSGEAYVTPAEAVRTYARLLPGSRVVHHLFWRYTAVWRRGAAT
jgi:2-polyprenyl-3-methyl-5-hydroxy-6-metoxy-1,4-benzoquinol methylase